MVSNLGKPNGIYKVHTEHVLGARSLLGGAVPLSEHEQRQLEQIVLPSLVRAVVGWRRWIQEGQGRREITGRPQQFRP